MTDSALIGACRIVTEAKDSGQAPEVKTFFDEPPFTATHVVHDPATNRAAIIDPVLDFDQAAGRTSHESADALIAYVEQNGLTVDWLLETHARDATLGMPRLILPSGQINMRASHFPPAEAHGVSYLKLPLNML